MDLSARLKRIEDLVFDAPAGDEDAGKWVTLQREFEDAAPAHANLVDTLARATRVRGLARLVVCKSRDPETTRLLQRLRQSLAAFCRQRRYIIPGAQLVRVYRGDNNLTVKADGGLLQVMAVNPMRGEA